MLISFFFAISLNFISAGAMKTVKTLALVLPFGILVALTNPLVSHFGKTVLFLVLGQAYTLESLMYGANLAVTLMSVVLYFMALGNIVDIEKILFLIGRILPNVAMLLTVTVKNITSVARRLSEVNDAQTGLGYFAAEKRFERIKRRVKTFGAVISLSLEAAVETAIAMRGKCYGVRRRTVSDTKKITKNDAFIILVTAFLTAFVFFAMSRGAAQFEFFPITFMPTVGILRCAMYAAFALACALPIIVTWKEELKWRCLISRL
jgi:energy-coupling factor transport system permease protein